VKQLVQRLLLTGFIAILSIGCSKSPQTVLQETTHSLSMSMDGQTLWKLHMSPDEGKPYVHPLSTTSGEILSGLRPEDHPWHRGLWFSWKYINGVNYWEEDRTTGRSEGQTLLLSTERIDLSNGLVQIDMQLAYAPADSGASVLEEQRTLVFHPPENSDTYYIDWSTTFTALDKDVLLNRTPIPGEENGKIWGGYAGYSLRMNKEVAGGSFTNSKGQIGKDSDRKPAVWMAYSGPRGSNGIRPVLGKICQ